MFGKIKAICEADTDDLAKLAEVAAPGDRDFFRGAQFRDADLRGTDLSEFQLIGVSLEGAQIDSETRLSEDTPITPDTFDRGTFRQIEEHLLAIKALEKKMLAQNVELRRILRLPRARKIPSGNTERWNAKIADETLKDIHSDIESTIVKFISTSSRITAELNGPNQLTFRVIHSLLDDVGEVLRRCKKYQIQPDRTLATSEGQGEEDLSGRNEGTAVDAGSTFGVDLDFYRNFKLYKELFLSFRRDLRRPNADPFVEAASSFKAVRARLSKIMTYLPGHADRTVDEMIENHATSSAGAEPQPR